MVVATRQGLICPPIADVIDQRLVLDIPFGEGKGTFTKDLSGKGNHGTLNGGVSWKLLPSGIWVLSFDGDDDYVDCGSDASLVIGTQNWSVEAWVKGTIPYSRVILGAGNIGDSNANGYSLYTADTGYIRSSLALNGSSYYVDSTINVQDGAWHHIVWVIDRDVAQYIYVNGKLEANSTSLPSPTAYIPNSFSFRVGRDGYIGRFWLGEENGVRICNRALSAGESKNRYNQTKHLFGK